MTIAQVTQGIVDALYTGLSGIKIYTESVNQSLDTPCVLVKCLNPSHSRNLGRRYIKSLQYSVQYFPNTENVYSECNSACESMFEVLEDITVDNRIIHGYDMGGEVVDGVLTFTVNYDVFLLREQTGLVDMGTADVTVSAE